MELNEINTLIKVVQTGSFTKAAKLLGTQKSNVSRTITNLESKLKVRLLERNNRTLAVTQVGLAIYEKCIEAANIISEAENLAKQELGSPTGVLKITCGVEFGMLFVSQWINDFLAINPEVAVEASFATDIVDIIQQGYDLAIRIGKLADSGLIAKRLGELQYGLFASHAYINQQGEPKSLGELTDHECVIFDAGFKEDWPFIEGNQTSIIKVSGRLRIDNLFSAMRACEQGLGIARLPLGLVRGNANLIQILPKQVLPNVPIYAVFPSTKHLSPKVRAFIELAKRECAKLELNLPYEHQEFKNVKSITRD